MATITMNQAQSTVSGNPLSPEELRKMNAYWRAANYLSVGQIYLLQNPLLREPLQLEHVKPRLLGHWGTTPGLNFVYVHFNRLIKRDDLNVIYIIGPGHGGPGIVANTYLEGTYSEIYPNISQSVEGMQRLFKQFSFPGGIPSHVAPETPGSIHEGGELGYSLSHAHGAAFDNPDLLVCCVVGDGEAETGPLATSWHANKFLNPTRDGAVLPILHLNGYKIANPTVMGRMSDDELTQFFTGCGYKPYFVEGHEPEEMHQLMAATLDRIVDEIHDIQSRYRRGEASGMPVWPMIVMRTPKGWTGPKMVDGKPVENTWRAHQVPLSELASRPDHLRQLEEWMKSYRPEELFTEEGKLLPELAELAPKGNRRMGANPHANGGVLLKDLAMPDFRDYRLAVPKPGTEFAEATRVLGYFLRDVMKQNEKSKNFRVFGPDETASNRLEAIYQVTDKEWMEPLLPVDEHLSPNGRVLEMLSEHMCQGWLEGYLLTGRHGFFSCYEAFIHIVDSMFNQHAKWLKVTHDIPVAPADRVTELSADVARLAAGPQWLHAPGSRLHRSRGEQESGCGSRLSAAGCQHAAFRGGSLPAQPPLRECDRCRQAARTAVARHGFRNQALHDRDRHMGLGQHRRECRAGSRNGVCRRCPHAGDAGCRRSVAPAFPGSSHSRGECRRPDDDSTVERTSAWVVRSRFRFAVSPRTSRSFSRITDIHG